MKYEIRKRPGVTEFRLKGRMEFADHSVFKTLVEAFDAAERSDIIFNLDELDTVDSSGLGMLIIAREEAGRRGLRFALEKPRREVKRVMDLARFERLFEIRA